MSVVAAYLYRNGRRAAPVSIDAPPVLAEDKSEFIWIGIFEPSEGELRTLQQRFDLHPLAVEDALKAHHFPKSKFMAISSSPSPAPRIWSTKNDA